MNDEGKSYRQILRSTSIVGGASIINILIGLIRIKMAAILLGPSGVGLIGLLSNLMTMAANVASLGAATVGTRQIAEAAGREDARTMVGARRALFWGSVLLASVGSLIFWLLRGTIATQILGAPGLSDEIGWLALGVGLTVAGGSQVALLNGLRRVGDLARISVYSALGATALGVGALLLWHDKGLLVYLLLTPVASFAVGYWYTSRLPKIVGPPTPLREMTQQWTTLVRLGMAFMIAGVATTAGQFLVRTLVQRELGSDALGHFEAAWVISMTYIGFVLRAMGTDYYPRLTAVMHDHAVVNKLINEQTEVALLLAAPVFLVMLGVAPWLIELLYSRSFSEATSVLRWQILGDVLKVASWPLGFVLLASGDGRAFILSETLATIVFVVFVWLGLPYFGLAATGIGFLLMYAIYLPLVYSLVRRKTGFRWTKNLLVNTVVLLTSGALVVMIALTHATAGAVSGIVTATAFGSYAFRKLTEVTELNGPLMKLRKLTGKLILRGKAQDK